MLNSFIKESSSLQNTKPSFAFLFFTEKSDFLYYRMFFAFLSDNGEDDSWEVMPKNFRGSAASILTFFFQMQSSQDGDSAEVELHGRFQAFKWPSLS